MLRTCNAEGSLTTVLRSLPSGVALISATQRVAMFLQQAKCEYAVAGRLALAWYGRAQFTDCLDIRILPGRDDGDALIASGVAATFNREQASATTLKVGIAQDDLERSFVRSAKAVVWEGADLRIACPEHLLWLHCGSDDPEDFADGVFLVGTGAVDVENMRWGAEAPRLARMAQTFQRADGSDYSESVRRRIATTRPK